MPITINGSGTVTGITAGGLPDGVITTDDIAANAISTAKLADAAITRAKMGYAGAILQVVQTYARSSHTATSSTSYVTTGLLASITPSSASNKILIIAALNYSSDTDTYGAFRLYRNGSDVVNARSSTASGNRENAFIGISNRDGDSAYEMNLKTQVFVDSPASTSQQTYEIYWRKTYGGAIYLGRPVEDSDNSFIIQSPYSLTLMEVAA